MLQLPSALQLPSPGKDTWEYKTFKKHSADITEQLAAVKLAGTLSDKLSVHGILGQSVMEQAGIYGPRVTETGRVRPIIAALKDKIEQNAEVYHDFRGILQSLGADADTALHCMPGKGKMILAHWHSVICELLLYFYPRFTTRYHGSCDTLTKPR